MQNCRKWTRHCRCGTYVRMCAVVVCMLCVCVGGEEVYAHAAVICKRRVECVELQGMCAALLIIGGGNSTAYSEREGTALLIVGGGNSTAYSGKEGTALLIVGEGNTCHHDVPWHAQYSFLCGVFGTRPY